ncbi:hypothetical protein NOR_08708 [Metarhizium rileyi]|uniref:Uncharacterized protein n=1 Tax=Metarhizium rileyi (strain RCEF 4871) TaxID=1649241 RepID=A0A166VTW1_METRR|nr:hypothetical protein NOR_08708 [Metarhizium rileyi RCEF 4871]
MAQTEGVCSYLDRPCTLGDVLSIPSDSESDTDSDAEVVEQDVLRALDMIQQKQSGAHLRIFAY